MNAVVTALSEAIGEIAPEYGISRAYLFGSFARGQQTEESDLDVVIELSRPLGFKRGRICLEIEGRLGMPVDLVFGADQLPAPVRQQFSREAVLIYEG